MVFSKQYMGLRSLDGKVLFQTCLVDGVFPNYIGVIPKEPQEHSLLVDAAELSGAFKKIRPFLPKKFPFINLTIDSVARMVITGIREKNAQMEVKIDTQDDPVSVMFNSVHLLNVCNAMPEGRIRFTWSDPIKVWVMRPEKTPEGMADIFSLVMPVQDVYTYNR
jgi:DNA polymerase III sliding clamp (beta) subunit (PCNA family)